MFKGALKNRPSLKNYAAFHSSLDLCENRCRFGEAGRFDDFWNFTGNDGHFSWYFYTILLYVQNSAILTFNSNDIQEISLLPIYTITVCPPKKVHLKVSDLGPIIRWIKALKKHRLLFWDTLHIPRVLFWGTLHIPRVLFWDTLHIPRVLFVLTLSYSTIYSTLSYLIER